MSKIEIPEKLKKYAIGRWEEAGKAWIESLPDIVQSCCDEFEIEIYEPFNNAYANLVIAAQDHRGKEVVLKIGVPNSESAKEQSALLAFGSDSAVQVLKHNPDNVAMLIERVIPGTMLTSIENDKEATKIAAKLMKDLHCDPPRNHKFDSVSDIMVVFNNIADKNNLPSEQIKKAQELYKDLDSSKKEEKLTHGDLHHYNILYDDQKGWIAIDPLGVVADPICEVGQYFHNPYVISKVDNPLEQTLDRAKIFAESFECSPKRVLQWAFVQNVISTCWHIEDNQDWSESFKWLEVIEAALLAIE